MKPEQTTDTLTIWGWFNIMSPLPLFLFTALWGLLILAAFGSRSESPVVQGIFLLPAFIHPVSCIAAFVRALLHRKHCKRNSILCMVLTAVGMAVNVLLWMFFVHLASVG